MRKPKNKGRKQKKQQKKLYTLGDGKRLLFSYSENRKICRQSHETSIALSREGHWNYWDIWTRGYPNRTRISNWFKVPRIFNEV